MKKQNLKVKGAFSTSEAAKVAGLSHRTVDFWARSKLIMPSISDAHGVGTDRKYSFADLLELRMVGELRQGGVPTQMIRRALDRIRKDGYPPKGEYRLVGVGSTVCIVRKGELENAISGQGVFAFMLDLAENRAEVTEQAIALSAKAA